MDEHQDDFGGQRLDSAGARLRAAREAQGLSIASIAERTRIPTRHLTMIESGEHTGLPAATYAVGFAKTYARLLGLDAEAIARQFRSELDRATPAAPSTIHYEPADPTRTPSRAVAWTSFALALLLIGGYLYWRGTTAEADGLQLAAQSSDRPAEAAPPPPHPQSALPVATPAVPVAAAAGTSAVLTATSPVWVKIYEPAGPTHFMGVLDTGKSYAIPADAPDPRLQTSRPNALEIKVGTVAIPTLGAPERLIKNVSLKADALVARTSAPPATPPAEASAPGQ